MITEPLRLLRTDRVTSCIWGHLYCSTCISYHTWLKLSVHNKHMVVVSTQRTPSGKIHKFIYFNMILLVFLIGNRQVRFYY